MNNKGQSTVGLIVITTVVGILSFLGGGSWLSKGQAKQDNQIAVLDTRVAITESNIKEIKDNVEYIRRAIEQSNKGLIIKAFSELATSTSKK